jgi:hypothetical protein
LTLTPYVFLTYQTRVPSRHTYLAAAGLALLIGTAFEVLPPRRWAIGLLCAAVVAGNVANLWIRKLPSYQQRAEATQRYLRVARAHPGPIAIGRAPFPLWVYQHAVAIGLHRSPESVSAAGADSVPGAFVYSDPDHP